MSTLVAVYGTLKRGFSNCHLLVDAQFLGSDTTRAITLYDLGPYPGAKWEASQGVEVEVFSVTPAQLQQLDVLEECLVEAPERGLYQRRLLDTRYGPAWVYLYNPSVAGLVPVPRHDWQPGFSDKIVISNNKPNS